MRLTVRYLGSTLFHKFQSCKLQGERKECVCERAVLLLPGLRCVLPLAFLPALTARGYNRVTSSSQVSSSKTARNPRYGGGAHGSGQLLSKAFSDTLFFSGIRKGSSDT